MRHERHRARPEGSEAPRRDRDECEGLVGTNRWVGVVELAEPVRDEALDGRRVSKRMRGCHELVMPALPERGSRGQLIGVAELLTTEDE